jgi:hypothetical protein
MKMTRPNDRLLKNGSTIERVFEIVKLKQILNEKQKSNPVNRAPRPPYPQSREQGPDLLGYVF